MRLSLYGVLVALTAFLAPPTTATAGPPPNGTLEVAYRQQEEGRLSDSVHQVKLTCYDGGCSLTTVTLNQCAPWSEGLGFFPKVQRTSTDERNLSVVERASGILVAEERYDATTLTYRFEYSVKNDADLAKTIRTQTTRFFDRLRGFSGAAVKDSDVMGKVIAWQLAPVRGRGFDGIRLVEPKCKMVIFSLPE